MFKLDEILQEEAPTLEDENRKWRAAELMAQRGILFALIGMLGHSLSKSANEEIATIVRAQSRRN